jgi:hypothetical protein
LMNSVELDRRIKSDEGQAARWATSEMSGEEIAVELYLSIFSRYPDETELSYVSELIDNAGSERRTKLEDLMWAMLNAPEFFIQN